MKRCRLILLLIAVLVFSAGTVNWNYTYTAMAEEEYTEEEKAQAKAWLSAHGYPPTREGANQAYQDYLDGKFDEELESNPELKKQAEEALDNTTEAPTDTEKTKKKKNNKKKKKKRDTEASSDASNTEMKSTHVENEETTVQARTSEKHTAINSTEEFSSTEKVPRLTSEELSVEEIIKEEQEGYHGPVLMKVVCIVLPELIIILLLIYCKIHKK